MTFLYFPTIFKSLDLTNPRYIEQKLLVSPLSEFVKTRVNCTLKDPTDEITYCFIAETTPFPNILLEMPRGTFLCAYFLGNLANVEQK